MENVPLDQEPLLGSRGGREHGIMIYLLKKILNFMGQPFSSIRGMIEKDSEAGNGKTRLENDVQRTFGGKSFKRRCLGFWGSLVMVSLLLLVIGAMGRYAFAGRFAPHTHLEGIMEFHPPQASSEEEIGKYDLAPLQKQFLRSVRASRISDEEISQGHLHTEVATMKRSLTERQVDEGGKIIGNTDLVVVDLDKLSESMRQYLMWSKETCISAPHVGVPVRMVYSKNAGPMLNPTVWRIGKETVDVTFTSPLGELKIQSPLTLELDYISRWGSKGRLRNRKLLKDIEAICVYSALEELGWEDALGSIHLREDL